MLNLNDLAVFLAAAETCNFSEAGRRLHLSQPAVSQTIRRLEERFGTRLFRRDGHCVRLTEAGQVLVPMARELLVAAKRLEETMASLQGAVVGEMTIGCSTSSGRYLLPGLIARFRARYPNVRVNVHIHARREVLDRLLDGRLGFGVSSKRVEHRDLEYQHFFTDEVILIVPADHPWAGYRRVFPDDLLDEPMILREEEAGTREVLLEGLLEHDISPDMLQVAMVLGSAEAIGRAVAEGIGVAFVSRIAVAQGLALGQVVEVAVEGLDLRREIYLVRNRSRPFTRAQAAFWEFVKALPEELDAGTFPSLAPVCYTPGEGLSVPI